MINKSDIENKPFFSKCISIKMHRWDLWALLPEERPIYVSGTSGEIQLVRERIMSPCGRGLQVPNDLVGRYKTCRPLCLFAWCRRASPSWPLLRRVRLTRWLIIMMMILILMSWREGRAGGRRWGRGNTRNESCTAVLIFGSHFSFCLILLDEKYWFVWVTFIGISLSME